VASIVNVVFSSFRLTIFFLIVYDFLKKERIQEALDKNLLDTVTLVGSEFLHNSINFAMSTLLKCD